MPKSTLPVNFRDDVLASAMGGKRRYNIAQNTDGTYSLEDVTTYTQVGSNFGAAQMNATNQAVNDSADKSFIIDNFNDLIANATSGKMAGALSAKEIYNKLAKVTTGNGTRNVTYVSADSTCSWTKCGRLCHVDLSIKQVNANTVWPDGALLFSGLPPALNDEQFSYPAMISLQNTFVAQNGLLLINTSGEIREHYYYKPMNGQNSKTGFTYICKD